MSKIQCVRGTRDLLPEDKKSFRFVDETAFQIARRYGYGEIETPIFEFSEVFHRMGETSDVVSKETYNFEDRGGDKLTLRPEGTAGVARAFVSEGLAQNLPLRLYYSGPMFRYERPQKGRYRQFQQLGVECLGLETPLADVECLALAHDLLQALGLGGEVQLEINTLGDPASRQAYRDQLVAYFTPHKASLSQDSRTRLEKNPLRILDSKDEGDRRLIAGAPSFEECLNEESKKFFARVLQGLKDLGISYTLNQRLVRGLDYYNHTVFEFTTDRLGAQGTVLAGGRYDGLIEMMGGPRTPGVGWAAGIDRLADLLDKTKLPKDSPLIALIPADEAGEKESLKVAHELRQKGERVEIFSSGNVGKKMKKANNAGAQWALILGTTEVETAQFALKNLSTGEQKTIPRPELKNFNFR
ncbi:MAG: histidine--tRNA ligase [Bdellovibrionaceae bacterium]|nr:histidine--tRNA ligase [Pseudobdellovibrionaceae bacterium]